MSIQQSKRYFFKTTTDSTGYTTSNHLARARQLAPDKINPIVTFLLGDQSKMFPLTFLTEGQKGGMKYVEINDIEYEWDVYDRADMGDIIVSTPYSTGHTPGIGHGFFTAIFETNLLKTDHLIVSPNGVMARIQDKPTPVGGNYEYRLILADPDDSAFCPLDELRAGQMWVMEGGAPVANDLSYGNESNKDFPGKMKNQISVLRKSYHMGGSIPNKYVEIGMNVPGKGVTKLWMHYEEYRKELEWKQACEEHLWYSKYNRRADGSLFMPDEKAGEMIPMGAGIEDQIPNETSYSTLTHTIIRNIISEVMYGATDTGKKTIVIYCGLGFMESFDAAMKTAANGLTFIQGGDAQSKFIRGNDPTSLIFGANFKGYLTNDDNLVVLKHLPLLDFGARAQNCPRHPDGKPITSHHAYFLDMSDYDGVKNIRLVSQRGRHQLRGMEKGMAPVGGWQTWKGNDVISTERDSLSVHYLTTLGVCINRPTHCFKLKCALGA